MTTKRKIPTNIEELETVAVTPSLKAAKDFHDRLKILNGRIESKKQAIDSILAQLDGPMRKMSEPHYANELAMLQTELRKTTDAERWEVLRNLQGAYESTSYVRENLGDPRKLATAHGLGEEKRSRLEASLASMGPAALASLAKKAEVTGDKDLAAALIAINDTLPAKERPFSSQSMAERTWGDEARKVRELAGSIDSELAAAMDANRKFEGRPVSGHGKLANGLKNPDYLTPSDKSAPAAGGKRSSTQLISDGLAAL